MRILIIYIDAKIHDTRDYYETFEKLPLMLCMHTEDMMIKRRKYFYRYRSFLRVQFNFSVSIFAQDEGADAAGSGTKGENWRVQKQVKRPKPAPDGTTLGCTVAVASTVGGILALAGGGGGGGSSVTTPQHH